MSRKRRPIHVELRWSGGGSVVDLQACVEATEILMRAQARLESSRVSHETSTAELGTTQGEEPSSQTHNPR